MPTVRRPPRLDRRANPILEFLHPPSMLLAAPKLRFMPPPESVGLLRRSSEPAACFFFFFCPTRGVQVQMGESSNYGRDAASVLQIRVADMRRVLGRSPFFPPLTGAWMSVLRL